MELVQLQLAAVVVVACSQYNNFKGDAWFRSLNIYIYMYIYKHVVADIILSSIN